MYYLKKSHNSLKGHVTKNTRGWSIYLSYSGLEERIPPNQVGGKLYIYIFFCLFKELNIVSYSLTQIFGVSKHQSLLSLPCYTYTFCFFSLPHEIEVYIPNKCDQVTIYV